MFPHTCFPCVRSIQRFLVDHTRGPRRLTSALQRLLPSALQNSTPASGRSTREWAGAED